MLTGTNTHIRPTLSPTSTRCHISLKLRAYAAAWLAAVAQSWETVVTTPRRNVWPDSSGAAAVAVAHGRGALPSLSSGSKNFPPRAKVMAVHARSWRGDWFGWLRRRLFMCALAAGVGCVTFGLGECMEICMNFWEGKWINANAEESYTR